MEVAVESGLEPYGIELATEAATEIARRFGTDRVFSGPFEQASFPGLGNEVFDGVFMCDFLEHVRDPLAVLKKAVSLLRPSGCLVITTPDGGSPSSRIMGASWLHYKVEHLHYFNRHNMAMLLQHVGLAVTHEGRAHKVLDLEYIRNQFNAYPRPVATSLVNYVARCAGSRLRQWPLSSSFGEMLVIGVKNSDACRESQLMANLNQQRRRLADIDQCKELAILLVVVGHVQRSVCWSGGFIGTRGGSGYRPASARPCCSPRRTSVCSPHPESQRVPQSGLNRMYRRSTGPVSWSVEASR